ncbi:DUF7507 domain-containing protein [Caulobacter mirabilis]|uniref:DUF7507 domain-containing protein n=1 Tax=Caulobacter mirabilis TaxID=69666 RepID=UPI001558E94B|nr:Calx-beta domain-containing protein [Caulobacter mirabilis]
MVARKGRAAAARLLRAAGIGALSGLMILSSAGYAHAQQRSILNTGFEAQNPGGPGAPTFQLFNTGAVTGWKAVANSNNTATQIELWDSGFQGVTSYEGSVHAEMNANLPGALYQEVCFTTGESIGWFFAHRARSGGANPQIANFEIANASGTVLQTLASQSSPIDNTWYTNSGTGVYAGPTGIQRIQFRTTNPGSVGNFLDAIQIDLAAYAEFSSATTSALEGAASPTVPSITVTGKVDQAVTIPLTITGGTATSGVDYTLSPLSITIPAGNYSGTLFPIPLTIINDSTIEADETVIVRLGTPSNAEIFLANTGCSGNPTLQATHTILDDDVDLRTNKTLSSANASPAEGDTVSFQIAVTNLGARAATAVTLTDRLPAGMTFTSATPSAGTYSSANGIWTLGNLAAGATATLTLTGTVNTGQAGNTITNTTTAATGTNVDNSRTAGDDLTESVVVNSTSGLSVTKSGVLDRGADGVAGVGDVITYSFTVRNTGTSALTNVALTERLPGAILTGGPIATLPRGATDTTTFKATYTLTQADVDRGRVDNTVDGTARDGTGATLTATGQTTTPIPQTVGLGITKTQTGGPTTVNAAGQTLTYTVVLRNTGNITQTNAKVVDTLPSAVASTLGGQTESILADGLLQPGETWTYTVSYVTTQADVDGGAPLVNSALGNSDQSSPVSATATTLVSRNPVMVVSKQVDRTSIGQPGVLNYTITLRNAGNVTLTGISVADTLPNGSAGVLSGPAGDGGVAGAIDVGETWTYTTTYTVTQAEIEAGTARVNTVTGRTAQINSPLTATATTTISRNPAVAIDKTVDRASISAPGVLNYTIKVSNTGNLALTGVSVSDTIPDGTVGALTGPTGDGGVVGTLDLGETWTYTASFNVNQARIDAGTALVNTARVTTTQTPTAVTDTATTTITATPALTVRKTVDRATISAPGVLNYTITVSNTGNQSLTGVTPTDTLPNGSAATLTGPTGDGGVVGTLDVGETWTYTTTYSVTQAEIDAGTDRTNTISVVSTQTSTPATGTAVTRIQRSPAITIDKTVDRSSIAAPGALNYTITVRNSGNVALTGVAVSDTLPDGGAGTLTGPTGGGGAPGVLDVGETWTYTTSFNVSQARIDAGTSLTNLASATSTQTPTAVTDTAVTTVTAAPALTVRKTVDRPTISAPGLLSYTITVSNTGNVSLTGVTPTDTLPNGSTGALTGPTGDAGVAGTLDVGETWTYTTTYSVTQAEIDAGTDRTNTVGVTTTQTPTPATGTAVTRIQRSPAITIDKTVDQASISAPGALAYTIVVRNTGNVALTGVTLSDTLPDGTAGALSGPTGDGGAPGVLDVGEAWTYTTSFNVSQARIDAGASLTNLASVTSTQTPTPTTDTAVTTVSQRAAFRIDKTVDQAVISTPGSLNYTIRVINTGNVSLTNVAPTDTLPDGSIGVLPAPSGDGGAAGVLDVGETWTYTISYPVDQARIEVGGNLINRVSVTTAETTSPLDDAVTSIAQYFSLSIDKIVDQSSTSTVGTVLNYTVTLRNTGNVSLSGLSVTDTLPNGAAGVLTFTGGDANGDTRLDLNEQWTYSGSYIVTQADIDNGATLVNTARATSAQTPVAVSDTATTIVNQNAGILVEKDVDKDTVATTGTLVYTIRATNIGNTTLSNVTPVDILPDGTTAVLSGPSGDGGLPGEIDVGETWTWTTTFNVNQNQLNAGADLINNVTVTATDPGGNRTDSDSVTTSLVRVPAMAVTKSVDKTAIAAPGTLSYALTVSNTGNVSLTNVTPVDTLPDGSAAVLSGPAGDGGAPGVLDVGETWTYTTTFNATQAQIDAGAPLVNSLSATSAETPTPATATATTTITGSPSLRVTKVVDRGAISAPGQLNYTITVANTGNVSLTGVTPTDTLPDGTAGVLSPPSGDAGVLGVLDVGETWTYTTTFNATQAQIDAGATLTNTVSVVSTQTPAPTTATAATTVSTAPGLAVTKAVDQTSISAPGTLTYTLTLSNTGNVSLTGVTPVDTLPDGSAGALSGPTGDGGAPNVLDVGETWTYTTTFNATQAQIDAGLALVNNLSVTTTQTPTPETASATTTVNGAPGLSVTKVVDHRSISAPGPLNYTITARNTGNQSLTGVTPTDTLPDGSAGALSGPTGDAGAPGVLDVGETWTWTATFNATQAQIDAGATLTNTVSVVSTQTPAPATATAATTISSAPRLSVGKTVDQASISAPGTLTYTLTLSNTGNVSLTGVAPVDTLPDGSTAALSGPTGDGGAPGVLDVGETWTYTTTFTVNQARIDAGAALVNSLSATTAETPTPETATATTTIAAAPELTATKTVDRSAISAPGVLNYVIRLRNAGNVSLTGVTPSDTLPDGSAGVLSGPSGDGGAPGVLDVGETWTYTTTFAVNQARIDASAPLVNTVSAVTTQTPTARTATATTTVSSDPGVAITKSVDHATVSSPMTLTYTIRALNTGNRSLGSVTLNDTLSNGGVVTVGAPQESPGGGTPGVLDVGETWTWTATYALTQADIDAAAALVNTATLTTDLTAAQSATATTLVNDLSELIVEKDVDLQQVSAPGPLTYSIRVVNGGNTRLMTPALTDTLSNGGTVTVGPPSESLPGGTAGVLDVGETWTYTATHAVTQAEIDAGADLVNTASATAQRPAGGALTADDTATTRITQRVDVELVKSGTLNLGADGRIGAGDTISFAFAVSNTGNVTINNLTLTDGLPGVVVTGGPIASLAAGARDATTFTGSYILTQADIDAGRITNPATVTGATSAGGTATASDDVTLALTGLPTITLDKTGSLNMGANGRADVGDVITYAFTVTNIGNVTVNAVSISDVLPGIVLNGGPIASLAPGASDSGTITAAYALTQADIDAGQVINTATASGQDPSGNPVSASDGLTIPIAGAPTITLDKTGSLNLGADGRADVGDVAAYAFTVTNTGNQTLTNVTITDALAGVTLSGGPIATLAPGASDSTTITATYALKQTDIDAGQLVNTATTTAAAPGGATVSANDSLTLPITGAPLLTLDKTGVLDLGGDGRAGVGDVITYAFTVTNGGNVTVSNVVITDALAGVTMSGGPIATLAPGASDTTTITATYALTQADVDAGRVINTATATGQTPSGDPLTGTDSVTVPVAGAPAVTLTKTATLDDGGDGRADAGDTIRYRFLVANTGNQTLTNITIADALAGVTVTGGPIATLAPGASDATTITATYVLTQADIDGGQVVNTATATGQGPGAVSVSDADSVTTPILGAPAIVATKAAALTTDRATQGVGNAGDVITYTVTVTNTGNTTLENLVVGDVFQGGAETLLACAPSTLPPGATTACTSYTHVITQDEANAGVSLSNTVSARAHVLGRPAVTATAGAATTTAVEPDPTDLQISKSAAPRDVKIGDLVRYTVTIVNVGTVDAVDVTLTDTPPGGFSYVEGSLSVDDADDAFRLAGVNPIRVDRIDVPVGQRATVVYLLRVGAGVRPGSHVNRAVAEDGPRVSNIATAEVRLVSDPLLDESLIVGTVFDDRDGDGWQDEGEPGIPGVRIASVEGLIVETDQFGRYHLVGVDGGPWERGRNFILKVDPVTLPPGSRFSTDNPLLRRVTPGLPVRFDFGVILPQAAAPSGQEVRP